MNTEEAFTPEQVTEVVGALHNATADKWIGAGLTLVIGAVIIKIVMQTFERLVSKLPLEKAMFGFLTAAAKIVMIFVLITTVAGQLGVPITSLVALLSLFALAVSLSVQCWRMWSVVWSSSSLNRLFRAIISPRKRRKARWNPSG